jgi:hypothetical protein
MSVECPCNTFDLKPEWERTFPFFDIFPWDIYRVSPKKIQISKLIFDTGEGYEYPMKNCQRTAKFFPLGV